MARRSSHQRSQTSSENGWPSRICLASNAELSSTVSSRSRITAGGSADGSAVCSTAAVHRASRMAVSSCMAARRYACCALARYSADVCIHRTAFRFSLVRSGGVPADVCGDGVAVRQPTVAARSAQPRSGTRDLTFHPRMFTDVHGVPIPDASIGRPFYAVQVSSVTPDAMLRLILTSRVYDVAQETPLEPAARLSARLDNGVLLKREDLQPVFSFKLRGAYNRIAHMTDDERRRGVIAASAGNHGQGVAFAARHLGLRAIIVMPQTTPEIKVRGGARDGRRGGPRGRQLRRCAGPLRRLVAVVGVHVRPSVRRSAGDRRPGHDRQRDPASSPRRCVGDLRARSAAAG